MGFEGLPPRFSGINWVVIILCDGIPMVKSTCTFTKGSFATNLFNKKLIGTDLLPCEYFLGWSQ
jgi:hypothetical protein